MATVTFDGTTLWDDSSSGRDRVLVDRNVPGTMKIHRRVPNYGGFISVRMGDNPGGILVVCQYALTAAQFSSLVSTIEGKKTDIGTLIVPSASGGTYSETNCELQSLASLNRTGRQALDESGTLRDYCTGVFPFIKLS